MLTGSDVPAVFQEGIDKGSNFTGVILVIDGVNMFGNVSTQFTEGTVYNVITSWSGLPPALDPFRNTYTKSTISFKLSNIIYRTATDGTRKRISDDLEDIVGSQADVYFVNNARAGALTDCTRPFRLGTVKSVSDYDNTSITITLDPRSVIGQTKILDTQMKDLFDEDALELLGTPLIDRDAFVPIVYGDYSNEGLTGLVAGLRIFESLKSPAFIFSNHKLKDMNALYVATGKGLRPAQSEGAFPINFNVTSAPDGEWPGLNNFTFMVLGTNAPPLIRFSLEANLITAANGGGDFREFHFNVGPPGTNDFTYLVNQEDGLLVRVARAGVFALDPYSGVYFWSPTRIRIGWEIQNERDFKAAFENSDKPPDVVVSSRYMKIGNIISHLSGWRLIYNKDTLNQWYLPLPFADDFTYDVWHYGETKTISGNSYTSIVNTNDPEFATTHINRRYCLAYWIATNPFLPTGEHIFFQMDEAHLELHYPVDADLETAYGALMGRPYNSWVISFPSMGVQNELIQHGAGIMASLLIDVIGAKEGVDSLSPADFDIVSFVRGQFPDVRVRLDIIDKDDTLDTIATKLGGQMPWTYFMAPTGKAKLATTRTVYDGESAVATIKYSEVSKVPKIGVTSDQHIINELTVKSRWFAEREQFMDEQVYVNPDSRERYGPRKNGDDTFEWKNIDSAQVGG